MLDLIPWRRKTDIEEFKNVMDNMFEKFIKGFDSGVPDIFRRDKMIWPSIDVIEDKKNIIVKAEIPGMDRENFEVSIRDNLLTIKGEKTQDKEEKDKNYHLVERAYGSFSRTIPLSCPVKEDKIDASYKRGVLKIVLPKEKESKESKIKVKVE